MDLCSLEDAFPNIDTGSVHRNIALPSSGFPFVGGTDAKASREERRAARKKAKKLKGPSLAYSDSIMPDIPPTDPFDSGTGSPLDPDRPAVKRMEPVASVQEKKDGFTIPVLPKASCLFSDASLPAYFGKDADDTDEGFSTFSAVGSDNPNYMLQPDVVNSFDLKGVEKAAGQLPEVNVNDVWKPLSPAASYTAFVSSIQKPEHTWSMNAEQRGANVVSKAVLPEETPGNVDTKGSFADRDALMKRVNELVSRLEVLEKKRSNDSQMEILVFVGTGVFLLLSLDLFTR
ncbi:hypothetical protein EBR66_07345 [bacterium]|nr:hypothetical protein [bacterium]